MKLRHGRHLAYCTNIHRGETWEETFAALKTHTLAVRDRVSEGKPFAIGLRLSHAAAVELRDRIDEFRHWLDQENCYVFTINGFPYGTFHGARVKESVYLPDWAAPERVEYTKLLFDLLARIAPPEIDGSVSTVPLSFKPFVTEPAYEDQMRAHVWQVADYLAQIRAETGRLMHLGLEPEPRCYLETTDETVAFFNRMQEDRPSDSGWRRHIGVNYDCCHLAVEHENAEDSLKKLRKAGILLSKIHLSKALIVKPSRDTLESLRAFDDPVYFHQVVAREQDGRMTRYDDLPDALADAAGRIDQGAELASEWRIHFHVPLHCSPSTAFDVTTDHLNDTLDYLGRNPDQCPHLEMETYTWEVLPTDLKNRSVVDQLVEEYHWTFNQLAARRIGVE